MSSIDFTELDAQLSSLIEDDTEENINLRLISVLEEAEDEVRDESIRKFQQGLGGLQSLLPNLVESIFSGAKSYGAPQFSQEQINLTKEFAGSFANSMGNSAMQLIKDKEVMDTISELEREHQILTMQLIEIVNRQNTEYEEEPGACNTLTTVVNLIEIWNDPNFVETEEIREIYGKLADLEKRKNEYYKNIIGRMTPDFAKNQGCIIS
jgi:hypothetical protein